MSLIELCKSQECSQNAVTFKGAGHSKIVVTFFESISTQSGVIMNPRYTSLVKHNSVFFLFVNRMASLNTVNTFLKCSQCSAMLLLYTNMSSIKCTTNLPINGRSKYIIHKHDEHSWSISKPEWHY